MTPRGHGSDCQDRPAKFDETVELHVKLGVDSRHADQQVRGAIVLPHGTGKVPRVLVFAKGDKADAAGEAGADYVGEAEWPEDPEGELVRLRRGHRLPRHDEAWWAVWVRCWAPRASCPPQGRYRHPQRGQRRAGSQGR